MHCKLHHAHCEMVLFRVLCTVRTWHGSHWWFSCSYGLFSRPLSGCKHDVDVPLFHPCLVDSKVLHPWALICGRESLTTGLEYEWNSEHIYTVAANSCNWHCSVLSSVFLGLLSHYTSFRSMYGIVPPSISNQSTVASASSGASVL